MPPGFSGADLFRMIGSMALVLLALGALLWMLRRMQARMVGQTAGRRMHVVETLSLNTRHKLALVRVDGRDVLVGVSPAQLTALAQWPQGDAATDMHSAGGTNQSQPPFDLAALSGQAPHA